MSSSTADFHASRSSAKNTQARVAARGRGGKSLRLVGDRDIDEYTEALAAELRLQLKNSGRKGNISLPSPEELIRRELDVGIDTNDSDEYAISDSALVDTVGPSWTTKKLRAELGGVSAQAVSQRVGRGALLALPTRDGTHVYPTFQFIRRGGRLEVKPGLAPMIKILADQDPWQVAVIIHAPAPELNGLSPVEWERRGGNAGDLELLARTLLHEWNRR